MIDRRLGLVMLLALAVRLSLWLVAGTADQRVFTADSADYWQSSREMLFHGEFAIDGKPEIFRTPGYGAFLMLAHLPEMLDKETAAEAPWRLPLAVQLLLDVVLVAVTYWLGMFLVSRPVALLGALLQAVSPVVAASSCRVLSDSLYALLLTTALLAMIGHLRTGVLWPLAVSAVILGAACYVRPVGMVMAVLFAGALLLRPRRLVRLAVFGAIFAACLAPWIVRNWVRADYCGFSTLGGDSLYYAVAESVARREGIDVGAVRQRFRQEDADHTAANHLTVGAAARYRQARAIEIICKDPWLYARIHLAGCLGFWLPGATDVLEVAGATVGGRDTLQVLRARGLAAAVRHYFGDDGTLLALAAPMVGILALKYLGLLAAVARAIVRRRVDMACGLLAAMVLASFLLPGPAGLPRFRVPVEPLLNLAAAAGLFLIAGLLRRQTHCSAPPS